MAEASSSPAVLYELVGHLPHGEMTPVAEKITATTPSGCLVDVLGIVPTHVGPGACRAQMEVREQHLNQRGIVQGGAIVAFADAAAGWASYAAVQNGRFTTADMTVSLLRPARRGDLLVVKVRPLHLGRRMLVLEAYVVLADDESKQQPPVVAKVKCTQLILS